MKATIRFDLEDVDDRMSHFRCLKSLDMALAMWTFAGKLRDIVDTSEDGKWIDEKYVWEAWEEVMEKHGIDFNELIR